MQFTFSAVVLSLLAVALALPTSHSINIKSEDVTVINIDPTITGSPEILDDLEALNNLCLGIADCNPVTVTENDKRDLTLLDLDPKVDASPELLTGLEVLNDLCVGIAVCNPVTVTEKN
ncbi:hypothetical protein BJ878DRAFT_576533 [Calycina marina]|uniref:Hydrophobin n=1 Tax=Calycina marina TaxID=1763456 RepID=A0A9P8CDX3_9HELO|nr:hypothetical protein BJ878DRAFT_576533 [Calycina marina]